jgi:O-antigen ligase
VVYWFLIHKPEKPNALKRMARRIVLIVAFALFAFQFVRVYENSRIKNRVESYISEGDARGLLITESLDTFANHPILGVGLGQLPLFTSSQQFSHNSYVEVLAEQGIIGGLFLFFLFFIPLKKSYRLFRLYRSNSLMQINLLFFLTFLLYNNFYPFYKFTYSMMYFFLIISIQNNFREKYP